MILPRMEVSMKSGKGQSKNVIKFLASCHRTQSHEGNNSMVGDLPLPYEDC